VHVDDNSVDKIVTESTNGDFVLLIDDETDCFHDVEMDYAGLKSEDYERRWWSSLNDDQKRGTRMVDALLVFIPVVIPLVGYFTYEPVAAAFDAFVDFLSSKNWVSVDGRQLQTQVLTPAVNGIVVPSVSILFANMISITISTLRQRQLSVLTALNVEAAEMRYLHSLITSFPINDDVRNIKAKKAKDRCQFYLAQYTTRLIAESKPGAQNTILQFCGSTESEMNGLQEQLNIIDVSATDMQSSNLLSQSYDSVTRINNKRSERLSALQSTFPPLHYAILVAAAGSILTAFLMECNQEILYFLSAIELRILWTVLTGTFASLAVVLYDLSDPFRGSYTIRRSTDQLYSLRASFETVCSIDQQKKEMGLKSRKMKIK